MLSVVLRPGIYRLHWSAGGGSDNFIVHDRTGGNDNVLVNEIPPSPGAGEVFLLTTSSSEQFQVEAATLDWRLKFTQIIWPYNPSEKPAPSTFTVKGVGSTVTNPIYIPAGNYKLAWRAQGGTANFIVHLKWDDDGDNVLVNEIPPNPPSGETVMESGGGYQLFEIEASTLSWTLTVTPMG